MATYLTCHSCHALHFYKHNWIEQSNMIIHVTWGMCTIHTYLCKHSNYYWKPKNNVGISIVSYIHSTICHTYHWSCNVNNSLTLTPIMQCILLVLSIDLHRYMHVSANWHSWAWQTCMYVRAYVHYKNRSLIQTLALMRSAITVHITNS